MSYLDDSLAHLEIFEGTVPWMYLDTKGLVTVGVGEMVANAARAESLVGLLRARARPVDFRTRCRIWLSRVGGGPARVTVVQDPG